MTHTRFAIFLLAAAMLPLHGPAAYAQRRTESGTLRLVIRDPSGAVIPNALVQVTGAEPQIKSVARADVPSDGQGVAVIPDLPPGRYAVTVSFPGFETQTIPQLRVRAGDNRRDVTLPIEKLDESVSVGRDPATAASDPNAERLGNVLSKEQIDALPDDPDEMEQALKNMAGPGATIRVDGFRGGKLPPKSQIRSIRFSSGLLAAEHHGGGMMMIDIATQPGMGPLRGGIDFSFRDAALNARNAFQPAKGPEGTQQYTFNLNGTLIENRTSFALSAGGASLYDSASIFAALPEGSRAGFVRRPSDRLSFSSRIDHALSKSHTLRASYQQDGSTQENLGVGNFDLDDRAYTQTRRDSLLRFAESGPLAKAWFAETRLQLHWAGVESVSAVERPTVRVLDAFTSGGAQQAGERTASEFEWATNIDWAHGRHAVRMGSLVEGGRYDSDVRTNYLGTFTFASLADYQAGRPAAYTRRDGDPRVAYSQLQAGFFVQDDWRARKNLTLSAGLRHEIQSTVDDRWNLAPRAGLTWSPFKNGRTTVRAGAGVFYDWLDADVFEETLRVDGVRQQELVVRNPGYPDPLVGSAATEVLPTSKYVLASDLRLPQRALVTAGVSQQISPVATLNVNLMHVTSTSQLRGRNVNAPDAAGTRPDPTVGTVTQIESTGRMQGDRLNVGLNVNVPSRRTFVFANYSFIRQRNDADGPFSLPSDSADPSRDWGPAAGVPRHVGSIVVNTPLAWNVRVGLSATVRSGTPYNITTGRDDNGDTVFTDRPAGVSRNSGLTKGYWDVGARLSYAFGFGERTQAGGGTPVMIVQRAGGDASGLLNALGGGGAENKRLRIELYASASNLFNAVNPIGYAGVMTSPFFGKPTAAAAARKLDLGVKIGF